MIRNLLLAFALSALIAGLAYWRKSLSGSGVVGALVVGSLTFGLGGWLWGLLLALFFVSSSLLSHYRAAEKTSAAEKFDKGHRRDLGQVLANGGLGSLVAMLSALVVPSPAWFPMFMGIMATVTADTWATELGTLARKPPRLITTGRQVEVGTSGGISPLGTAFSLAGGLTIGLTAGVLSSDLAVGAATLVGAVGGLMGSLFDSLLGATVQRIYYCERCQRETERKIHRCGHQTSAVRGWFWLNNDLVNLLASAMGGFVAVTIWALVG